MLFIDNKPVIPTLFPDNTSQVWKLALNESRHIDVRWEFAHEGEFMQLAQLKHLLDEMGKLCRLHITYLPYARQDKKISNESTFAVRTFSKLLNMLAFKEITIVDPHSQVAIELIRNSRPIYPTEIVLGLIKNEAIDIICYPDAGATMKYQRIYNFPWIYGEKARDPISGYITSYRLIGAPKDKAVLIVDDICDGGATFEILAKNLLSEGAKRVVLFVTHGIYSRGIRRLYDSGIDAVYDSLGFRGRRYAANQI